MTDRSRSHGTDPGPNLVSPEVKQQLASVARGERLQHSGVLDFVSALGVLVGFFFLPDGYGDGTYADADLAKLLLAVAAGVLVLRGVVRLLNYWST